MARSLLESSRSKAMISATSPSENCNPRLPMRLNVPSARAYHRGRRVRRKPEHEARRGKRWNQPRGRRARICCIGWGAVEAGLGGIALVRPWPARRRSSRRRAHRRRRRVTGTAVGTLSRCGTRGARQCTCDEKERTSGRQTLGCGSSPVLPDSSAGSPGYLRRQMQQHCIIHSATAAIVRCRHSPQAALGSGVKPTTAETCSEITCRRAPARSRPARSAQSTPPT